VKSFTAMLLGSIGIAALFFALVLLGNAYASHARPIRYLCPDRYRGGPVQATKWNVVHLVCIRSGR